MHFQVKMPQNGKDKQTTNKKLLMFLDVKMLSERYNLRFWTLSTNKQGTVYIFSVLKLQNKQ